MKIIEKYITRELLIPFFVVIGILIGLFSSFSIARFLTSSVLEPSLRWKYWFQSPSTLPSFMG